MLDQVRAVALQEVQRHPGTVPQHRRQGLRAGALQQQRIPAPDGDGALDDRDEPGALQGAQDLGLALEAGRGRVVERHLEDPLGVRVRRSETLSPSAVDPLPQALVDAEPPGQQGARGRLQGVDDLLVRLGQLALGVTQQFQEAVDVGDAARTRGAWSR